MDRSKDKYRQPDIEISDDDIYEAMKDIGSYLDITSKDFKEIYKLAFKHAVERIATAMKAKDIMTREVFFVRRETPLNEVVGLMAEKSISGVPVLENDNKIIGVISEKDFLSRMGVTDTGHFMGIILACLRGKECIAEPMMSKRAGDIMTSPAVTVGEDASLMEIADIFSGKNINRVPVVDRKGHLLGLVSRADIIRAPLIRGKKG